MEANNLTTGPCLLCMRNNKSKTIITITQKQSSAENNETTPPAASSSSSSSSLSLKNLCNHLKINMGKIVNEVIKVPDILGFVPSSSLDNTGMMMMMMKVTLCATCESVTERFSKLYQEQEQIHLEMDHLLKTINQTITEAKRNSDVVQGYRMVMTKDIASILIASFLDGLRNEISEKCSTEKFASRVSQINLNRITTTICKNKSNSAVVKKKNSPANNCNNNAIVVVEKPKCVVEISNNDSGDDYDDDTTTVHSFRRRPEEEEEEEKGNENGSDSDEEMFFKIKKSHSKKQNSTEINASISTIKRPSSSSQDEEKSNMYTCDICCQTFSKLFTLKTHTWRAHRKKWGHNGHDANQSPSSTLTSSRHPSTSLNKIKFDKSTEKYLCPVESKKFISIRGAKVHYQHSHHHHHHHLRRQRKASRFVSLPAATENTTTTTIAAHPHHQATTIATHHQTKQATSSKTYSCKICSETFPQPVFVRIHMRKAHSITTTIGTNSESSATTTTIIDANWTENLLNNNKKPIRNRPAAAAAGIRTYRKHHLKDKFSFDKDTGKWNCKFPNCDKNFTTMSGAYMHFGAIHQQIKHVCNICNVFSYTQKHNLIRHKMSCGRKVLVKKDKNGLLLLAANNNFHLKERNQKKQNKQKTSSAAKQPTKPPTIKYYIFDKTTNIYKCITPSCTKVFKTIPGVNMHFKAIHLKERFTCKICKNYSSGYLHHVQAHEKTCGNVFSCGGCDLSFRNVWEYRSHGCAGSSVVTTSSSDHHYYHHHHQGSSSDDNIHLENGTSGSRENLVERNDNDDDNFYLVDSLKFSPRPATTPTEEETDPLQNLWEEGES